MIARCPHCQLPMTDQEAHSGACPVCEGTLSVEPTDLPDAGKSSKSSQGGGRGLLLMSVAGLFFLAGSASGFALRPLVAEDSGTNGTPNQLSQSEKEPAKPTGAGVKKPINPVDDRTARNAAGKTKDRVKELAALVAKLGRERDVQKKEAEAAKIKAEEAARDAKKARAEANSSQSVRVKELQSLADKLNQELDVQQKLTVEANARAAKVKQPPADHVKTLETLTAKLRQELQTANTQTQQAKAREAVARRTTDQVRRESQQTLAQVRRETNRALQHNNQQHQKTINRVHKQHVRAIDSVRRQLDKQRRATQKALAEAAKQRKAAEDARR